MLGVGDPPVIKIDKVSVIMELTVKLKETEKLSKEDSREFYVLCKVEWGDGTVIE